ncbi:replication protein A 70 kDa DNA-binding subunit B [Tanacetum coccineum]
MPLCCDDIHDVTLRVFALAGCDNYSLFERGNYEANNGYNASEFKIEIHNPDIHVVTPAEFMQGCLRKMVGMIRDIEPETYCVVYATIHSIQYENGWAYTACKACNTKVTPIQSKVGSSSRNKKQLWHCKNHGETYAVVSRFKIIVRIFDESGSAQVVLFDNNVYKMTKLSAWQIMEEQGMDANQYFPDDLNQIIGKQYLFKIKYSQFNHNNNSHVYRAEKVTQDVETINYFQNGFVKYEDEDEEYDCESDEMNENEKDDHTSPSVEINENVQAEFENNEITTTNDEEPGEKNNIVYIDLSDYETEDEEEDLNTTKKLITPWITDWYHRSKFADWTNSKNLENRIGSVRVLKHDKGRPDKQKEGATSVAWNVSATASWTIIIV